MAEQERGTPSGALPETVTGPEAAETAVPGSVPELGTAAVPETAPTAVQGPLRGGMILATLIISAAVANINMAVALPSIGQALGSSQAVLNMVAVGFTLGLAASVLYLGALADRFGRRLMLLAGLGLSIPAAALATWAPTIEVLIVARIIGGLAAGMAFPTTLSLVTALFRGARQVSAIALWSGIGAGASSLGPVAVGALLTRFWWGSAFAITIPLAVVALVLSLIYVPRRAGESDQPVDHVGGFVSVLLVGSVVLAINLAPIPGNRSTTLIMAGLAVFAMVGFIVRQRRAPNPLFDLKVARRRIFWVAALAGIIAFGALMGALFIGQQFLQDVLGYSALHAGLAILPSALLMIAVSPLAARVIRTRGSKTALLAGFSLLAAGFVAMLFWREGVGYLHVGIAYALIGAGVGMGGAPASRSVMGSVPVSRAGMGSATTDLQRDLGGAVMQSVLGALLSIRYATFFTGAFSELPPERQQDLSEQTAAMLKSSFGGAAHVAKLYPGNAAEIMEAARQAFTQGSRLAVGVGLGFLLLGLAITAVYFPNAGKEHNLNEAYEREDAR